MTWLTLTQTVARPWFAAHGATLTDAFSFEFIIGMTEKEIADMLRTALHIRSLGYDSEAEEIEREIAGARNLLDDIRDRLEEIRAARDPAVAEARAARRAAMIEAAKEPVAPAA